MKKQAANELVRILVEDQQADGSFLSYSVPAGELFGAKAKVYRTTFAPALILDALSGVEDRQLAPIREQLADWLLAEHGPQWSYNYWAGSAAERKAQPYPDDWDDTSCAVAALTHSRPEAVTGEVLGHIVTMLTNTEAREGGPYRTWILGPDAPEHWHDVDIAVNANIAYMLKLHGVDLPNLESLADEQIRQGELRSPYYPSAVPIEYFLSRWYQGAQREQLLERVLTRQKSGGASNPLDAALTVSAALNLGDEPAAVAKAVEWLRGLSAADIKPYAFCIDPAIGGKQYVAGSRALTAALCLEAITKYDAKVQAAGDKERTLAGGAVRTSGAALHEQVLARAMARFDEGGGDIGGAARRVTERLMSGTAAQQITLLPYLFRKALGKNGRGIRDQRLVELGVISFYGWLAYTIYDDFLDAEGVPTLLPAANLALRELVLALNREAERTPGFGDIAWETLDRQEAANAWEVSHCRVERQSELLHLPAPLFGDLAALAERSTGHALGCVAMAIEQGHTAGSAQMRALHGFFHHFLIARQLSDDAYDWKADLQKGQINAVGALLLDETKQRGRSVRELYGRLEQVFWERGIGEVNTWIFRELAAARAELAKATFIEQPQMLEALLAPIEEASLEAQEKQRRTVEFLRTYNPEQPGS